MGVGGPSASATVLGTEASLSVLADSSVGFEPPAPPGIDPHHQEQKEQRRYGNQSSSSVDEDGGGFETAPAGGASTAEIRFGDGRSGADNGGDSASGRNRRVGDDCGGSERRIPGDRLNDRTVAGSATPKGRNSTSARGVGGGGRGDGGGGGGGVLHGVSAAMASRALPSAQFHHAVKFQSNNSSNNSISSRQEGVFLGHGDSGAHRIHQRKGQGSADRDSARRVGGDGHSNTPEGGAGYRGFGGGNSPDEITTDNKHDEAGSSSASRLGADDAGELARRHVDQALRERAHRRRHRFVARPSAPRRVTGGGRAYAQRHFDALQRMLRKTLIPVIQQVVVRASM